MSALDWGNSFNKALKLNTGGEIFQFILLVGRITVNTFRTGFACFHANEESGNLEWYKLYAFGAPEV